MEHFYQNTVGESWFDFQDFYSWIVKQYDSGAHFIEVGVWKGRSACYMAVEIINSNKNIKFDCIDTWIINTDPVIANEFKCYEPLSIYDIFEKNIEPVKHIINPIKALSYNAPDMYEDNSIDFVFIDASHDYESVKKDIVAWYPKVKQNGIISGHDYFNEWCGVKKAVDETFNNVQFNGHCWLVRKENC